MACLRQESGQLPPVPSPPDAIFRNSGFRTKNVIFEDQPVDEAPQTPIGSYLRTQMACLSQESGQLPPAP